MRPHVLAAVLVVASCSGRPAMPRAEPLALPTFEPADADVWAWSVDVGGNAAPPIATCRVGDVGAAVSSGRWSARLPLAAGTNRVQVTCADVAGNVVRSPTAELRAKLRDAPTARIAVRGTKLDGSSSTPSGGSHAPIVAYEWSHDGGITTLLVRDARGATDTARIRVGAPPSGGDVVYGVVPPLFGSPPLRAVRSALGDLVDLGVDVLWLAPVFATPPDDYGYAVTDYLRVREDYGTEADLVALVDEAHRRGLRILLDLVPNHTSSEHRYFREAEALGPASHYFSFYERDDEQRAKHYFDWTNLPNLEYANAEVDTWMLYVAAHWMRTARVDGYRIDAAWGIEQRAPSFWPQFVAETRRIDPDALLVAEGSAADPFWREQGFDAAYDWTLEPGHWAWEHVFDAEEKIADRLDEAVLLDPSPAHVLRFLENNDTGPRFVTRHGASLTRVAAAALFTLPGMPSLFTGQERGAEYEPYRRKEPLPRDDPNGLRAWYRTLVGWRREVPALRGAGYARVPVEAKGVFAFERWDERSAALVVLDFAGKRTRVRVEGPRTGRRVVDIAPWSANVYPSR